MNRSPLVSVITATYNNAEHIEACIDSMLNQTLEDWEWIIVNNGSTDNTSAILGQIIDARINVIELASNEGVSGGRNHALAAMKGKYFCFLDGDDIFPSESLIARAQIMEANNDISVVDGSTITFQDDVSNAINSYTPTFEGVPLESLLSLDGSCFFGNTWMIRREGVEYAFQPGLTHGEEILFYAQFAAEKEYSFTPETILFYRKHGASAMSNLDGLLNGYVKLGEALNGLSIPSNYVSTFKRAAQRIMFRSFVKQMRPLKAIRAWFALNS